MTNTNNGSNTPKKYKLVHISDILDIPEDRFDMFLKDLEKWHSAARNIKKSLDLLAKAANQTVDVEKLTMTWIDDGEHKGKVIIKSEQQQ